MTSEWQASAHAGSATSTTYLAARKAAGTPKQCDRCHAPLRGHVRPTNRAIAEGVTCDVCHTIKEVSVGAQTARFTLRVSDAVKYGPFCDAKDHYFHRMGCAPSQTDGTLCAGCHQLVRTTSAGPLPIYTTYADWKAGPAHDDGLMCQHCHMPATRAEAAEGAGERAQIRDHGFMGTAGKLRTRAVTLTVAPVDRGNQLAATITVANTGAGHHVPSGAPARRLVVRAFIVDAQQRPQAQHERSFGRVLVDAAGKPAPHYQAARVAEDSRIAARKSHSHEVVLAAPGPGELRVQVWWRPLDHAVAARMGVAPGKDALMIEARIPFGGPGKRALATKPVIVKP